MIGRRSLFKNKRLGICPRPDLLSLLPYFFPVLLYLRFNEAQVKLKWRTHAMLWQSEDEPIDTTGTRVRADTGTLSALTLLTGFFRPLSN